MTGGRGVGNDGERKKFPEDTDPIVKEHPGNSDVEWKKGSPGERL